MIEDIISAVPTEILEHELNKTGLLGKTNDGMSIFLSSPKTNSEPLLLEIARLREITFRAVGEGTGKSCDLDKFDDFYYHLIIWNDESKEIAGSYRLGYCNEIIKNHGYDGIYNFGQFTFSEMFKTDFLPSSLELGRSFILQKYWRGRVLDYLWQGIGAFLRERTDIKYMWGATSISNSYSDRAKNLIVAYYRKWYGIEEENLARANKRFVKNPEFDNEISEILCGSNYEEDFKNLKKALVQEGVNQPVLLRRYVELCDFGGAKFMEFGIDPEFGDSIDCLIILTVSMVKASSNERFYNQKSFYKPEN
jgi:hypothetical protein